MVGILPVALLLAPLLAASETLLAEQSLLKKRAAEGLAILQLAPPADDRADSGDGEAPAVPKPHKHRRHSHHKGHHHHGGGHRHASKSSEEASTPRSAATADEPAQAAEVKLVHFTRRSNASLDATSNLDVMRQELRDLRSELAADERAAAQDSSPEWDAKMKMMEDQIADLERMLVALQAQEAKRKQRSVTVSHAELQAEIDRLKEAVHRIEHSDKGVAAAGVGAAGAAAGTAAAVTAPTDGGAGASHGGDGHGGDGHGGDGHGGDAHGATATAPSPGPSEASGPHAPAGMSPVQAHGHDTPSPSPPGSHTAQDAGGAHGAVIPGPATTTRGIYIPEDRPPDEFEGPHGNVPTGLDVDSAMPYGDLEPFGREDTARELTEASIAESDAMVDQLERAEIAEEKRAIFRALTRLRGAAITSFDGIARSQTGTIDEYSRTHRWREEHPLRHLANEEADVTKWAFPKDSE